MSQKQKVILFSGKMGSGKSTIAKILKEMYERSSEMVGSPLPKKYKIFSFASKLKQIAREQFGWDGQKDEKGRILLQRLGTEVGRAYNPNIWVDYFSKELSENKDTIYFVDDWRFPNERDAIEFDGELITVRIHREGKKKGLLERLWDFLKSSVQEKHASEVSLPDDPNFYDLYLENNYNSIDELKKSREFKKLYNNIYKFIIN